MEIITLDSNFLPCGKLNLRYINLQWTRRYYEVGEFSVQILYSEYVFEAKYIYCPTRREVGIIQKIEYKNDGNKKVVQLTGHFLEIMLSDKIIYPTFYGTGNVETAVRNCFNTYKEDMNIELGDVLGMTNTLVWQSTGAELHEKFYELLETYETSYRCTYDYVQNKIFFELFKGLDRTQSQSVNNFVCFSSTFNNIRIARSIRNSSGFKNYAVVAGQGEGADRIYTNVDMSGGAYKQKLYVDARDLQYDDTVQTYQSYIDSLVQRGKEKLLDHALIDNTNVDVSPSPFIYLEDFDLGDKVTVKIDDLNLIIEKRIIEIIEVIKNGTHDIKIIIGEKNKNFLEDR